MNTICHNWIRRLQYHLAIIGFGDYSLPSLDSVNTICHNWIRRLQFTIYGFGDYILPSLDSAISNCHNWIRRLQFAIIGFDNYNLPSLKIRRFQIYHHWIRRFQILIIHICFKTYSIYCFYLSSISICYLFSTIGSILIIYLKDVY